MNHWQNYDDTYQEALSKDNPQEWIEARWGNPRPYWDEFVRPYLDGREGLVGIDIGAGFGRYTKLLAGHCRKIYAVEPSFVCADQLVKIPGVVVSNMHNITDQIDIAISFSCFCHFNQYEMAWYFRTLSPHMKQNAPFVMHYSSFTNGGDMLFSKQKLVHFGDTGRYWFHNPDDVSDMLRLEGFLVEYDEAPKRPIVAGHRVAVCRKT